MQRQLSCRGRDAVTQTFKELSTQKIDCRWIKGMERNPYKLWRFQNRAYLHDLKAGMSFFNQAQKPRH